MPNRSAETQQLIQDFIARAGDKLLDLAVAIAEDSPFDNYEGDDLVRYAHRLIRFVAAIDYRFNHYSDRQVENLLDHVTEVYKLKDYPIANFGNWRMRLTIEGGPDGPGAPGAAGSASRLQSGDHEIVNVAGVWRMLEAGSTRMQTIATVEKIFSKLGSADQTAYTVREINDMLKGFLPTDQAAQIRGAYTEQEASKVSALVEFQKGFTGVDPTKLITSDKQNQPGGFAGLDSLTGKLDPKVLPSGTKALLKGQWNAASNQPVLSNQLTFPEDSYYIVTTGGNTPLGGIASWKVGDHAVWSHQSKSWFRVPFGENYGVGDGASVSMVFEPDAYVEEDTATLFVFEPENY